MGIHDEHSVPGDKDPRRVQHAVRCAVKYAPIGRDAPAVGQLVAVPDHGDTGGAVAVCFDGAGILDLSALGGKEPKSAHAERDADGEVAHGDDVARIENVKIKPGQRERTAAARRDAHGQRPVRLDKSEVAQLMPVAESPHADALVRRDADHALVHQLRVREHALQADATRAAHRDASKIESGSILTEHKHDSGGITG